MSVHQVSASINFFLKLLDFEFKQYFLLLKDFMPWAAQDHTWPYRFNRAESQH
jgi:hypothetical protein